MLTDRFDGHGVASQLQRAFTQNGASYIVLGLGVLALLILLVDYGRMLYLRSKMVG